MPPVTRRSQRAEQQQRHGESGVDKGRREKREAVDGQEQQQADEESRVRYGLRVRSAASRSGGRLSRVDDVLHRLKRQRERREGREWMEGEGEEEMEEEDEEAESEAEPTAADYEQQQQQLCSPVPPSRRRPKRARSERSSHRLTAADEYDDGSGFVVHSDEADEDEEQQQPMGGGREEEADEAIGHMRLHNQLQAASDDDDDDDDGGHAEAVERGAAHTASSPLAALFPHSHSYFGPVLSLDVAFHYWMQYLASVMVDEAASSSLLSLSAVRWLLDKAVKVVEEQFDSRLSNWVQSSLWQQRGRERFYTAVTQLPYITSRTITAYDAASDSEGLSQAELEETAGGGRLCDTCRGQHQASHCVEIMGIPYDCQQLKHPFDAEKIFRYGLEYTREVFFVGELCHRRIRLYHAMRHFKLRSMLILRALLDKLGAVPGEVTSNIAIVRAMFPQLPSTSPASQFSFSSAAARTASFLSQQQSIHQRLWAMSEGYTSNDTRTVRSVAVSQLDELYDIVHEACSSKLFALRPSLHRGGGNGKQQQQQQEDDEEDTLQLQSAVGTLPLHAEAHAPAAHRERRTLDDAALPAHRRLLLDALVKNCTIEEVRYLFLKLSSDMQKQWLDFTHPYL